MHTAMAFNLQNTNKQKEKLAISQQSDGTMKYATKSESLTQKIRGSLCSPHDQLLQRYRTDGSMWRTETNILIDAVTD